jgi:hypothetical protein
MPAYDLPPYEEIQQGECSLETLSVAEFGIQRVHFNWCIFIMNEFMAACTDAHATRAAFIYGYLFLTFAMRNFPWCQTLPHLVRSVQASWLLLESPSYLYGLYF